MGRFAQKYTGAQKQAICEAVLDQGLTRPQAIAQAKAGKLGDFEPFTMPIASLDHYLKLERRKREGRAAATNSLTPLERLDNFTSRTLNMLDHELGRLEKKAMPGKGLSKEDAEQLKRLSQVAREIKALGLNVQPIHGTSSGSTATRRAAKADDEARKQAEAAPSLAEKMARDMHSEPAPDDPPALEAKEEGSTDGALASHVPQKQGAQGEAEAGGVLASAAPPSQLVPA